MHRKYRDNDTIRYFLNIVIKIVKTVIITALSKAPISQDLTHCWHYRLCDGENMDQVW